MEKDYYIGLDIGTDSIGWAVTDTDYKLCKKRGRDFWGVYLFDAANTAEKRRLYRSARRRTARVHQRLMLLQELFSKEIFKIDPTFFIRLKNSSLHLSDKDTRLSGRDSLFSDANFSDKDYHEKYKTIYHLRSSLLRNPAPDIRLLYLALHHIIKNRGHFLFESQNFDVQDTENVIEQFDNVNNYLADRELATFEIEKVRDALTILKDKAFGVLDKTKKLKDLFVIGKNKHLECAVKVIAGGKCKLKDLYANDDLEDVEILFEKENFDEEILPAIESQVGDDVCFVKYLKAIYDWSILSAILGEEKYISDAKVNIYEKHKKDLKILKELVKSQDENGDLYKIVFKKADKVNNYAAYVGKSNGRNFKKCSKKDFEDFLKKKIDLNDYVFSEIEKGSFLPKQVAIGNGVIPYQVHLAELKQILSVSAEKYPFLNEKDGDLTFAQKIESLMTFRIPYYVGPLHTASCFAWAKRNEGYENVSITPWNFDQAIDKDESEERFIKRMTNKCTYLVGEDVLPASSLLYSEFAFLNELNALKVNGQTSKEAKKIIYEYARNNKKVTLSACLKLLKSRGLVEATAKKEDVFSGIDGDFKNSLSSYVVLKGFLRDKVDLNSELCEEIIERITLISSDKTRVEQTLKNRYGKFLSDQEIKNLKGLNFSKWGRFSRKLLTEIFVPTCCDENGEVLSIIDVMRRECKNFMQVIHEYGFNDTIEEYNQENSPSDKVTYKTVEDLYCSPSVKRAIWRTLDLTKEIVKIMGGQPKKIFIEMARDTADNGKKGKRTVSRKQNLIDKYRSIKDEERDWIAEINDTKETKFNSQKLVLYYLQRGVCMYTGKKIPLKHVFNTNICDIEHIYPQSKIKDDSIDNTMLVYKVANASKSDKYPVSADIQSKMSAFWLQLKKDDLISEKKYERLIRKTALTQDELTDFINRQLVETRQSTKAAASLLKRTFKNAEIVYSKAANADTFKQENGLLKVRELNDLHHAKDAYINIVVGNVYNTKFNHNAAIYFKNNNLDSYNIKRLYSQDIPNAWKVSEKQSVIDTYNKNTCRVVRFTQEGKGQLYNATIKTKKEGLIPLKEGGAFENTAKYGGYDSATTAYFSLVKSVGKKGKTVLSLEAISIYDDLHLKNSREKKLEYFKGLGLENCEILIDKIKPNTLLNIDGSYAYIRGKTGSQIILWNANELMLDKESVVYLKKISNCFKDKKKYFLKELPIREDINAEENLKLYDALIDKLSSSIYSGLSISGQVPLLLEKRSDFCKLSLQDQMHILFEILKLMQCNYFTADFTKIGGSGRSGTVYLNKFIQDKKVKIILQSPTGHYRQVIDCSEFL